MVWSQLGLQEASSITIEVIHYFYDYMIVLLVLILVFVTYVFVSVMMSPYMDSYTVDSHVLETIWTVVPMIILIFIAFPSLYLLYIVEELEYPCLYVKVLGAQWHWEYEVEGCWSDKEWFSNMDQGQYSSVLTPHNFVYWWNLDVDTRVILPSEAWIIFLVTSSDVLHSWTVPSLGVKVDAVPGRLNYVMCMNPDSGVFYGQCSEICGVNHSFMPVVLEFIPMSEWVAFL